MGISAAVEPGVELGVDLAVEAAVEAAVDRVVEAAVEAAVDLVVERAVEEFLPSSADFATTPVVRGPAAKLGWPHGNESRGVIGAQATIVHISPSTPNIALNPMQEPWAVRRERIPCGEAPVDGSPTVGKNGHQLWAKNGRGLWSGHLAGERRRGFRTPALFA